MTTEMTTRQDASLDLVMERYVTVPPELVWKAWTQPEMLKQWFTPAPWKTAEVEVDLRPGGIFRTVMQGPEGEEHGADGCFLEVVENERLVWTSALGPGFRPIVVPNADDCTAILFTAVITMESVEGGTKYRALVKHADVESSRRHAEMGFHEGWGAAFDQLLALVGGSDLPRG